MLVIPPTLRRLVLSVGNPLAEHRIRVRSQQLERLQFPAKRGAFCEARILFYQSDAPADFHSRHGI